MRKDESLILFSDAQRTIKLSDLFCWKIYREISPRLTPEKQEEDRQTLNALAHQELQSFSGDILNQKDMARAWLRVLKLTNLGLEHTLGKTRTQTQDGIAYDEKLAKAILVQKPLELIFHVGSRLFSEDRESISNLLKQSSVHSKGLWFSLINQSDREILLNASDLDKFDGTWQAFHKKTDTVEHVARLLEIRLLFPTTEETIDDYARHLGSANLETIQSPIGMIQANLNSLLIASMFRRDEEFYSDSGTTELTSEITDYLKKHGQTSSEETIDAMVASRSYIEEDIGRDKLNFPLGTRDKERKISRLSHACAVKPHELKEFVETCYLEPHHFQKMVPKITERFNWYFKNVQKALKIRNLKRTAETHADALIQITGQKLIENIRAFYSELPEGKEDDMPFWLAYWRPHLIIFHTTYDEARARAQKEAGLTVLVEQIVDAETEQLLETLSGFHLWPREKQEKFVELYNPIPLAEREAEKNPKLLLNLLLSVESPSMLDNDTAGTHKQDEAVKSHTAKLQTIQDITTLAKQSVGTRLLQKVMEKINWNYVSPHAISELWYKGSDAMREFLVPHFDRFKVTLPSIKHYYLQNHTDFRLLHFVLAKFNDEKGITEDAWETFLYIASTYPKLENILHVLKRDFQEEELNHD